MIIGIEDSQKRTLYWTKEREPREMAVYLNSEIDRLTSLDCWNMLLRIQDVHGCGEVKKDDL